MKRSKLSAFISAAADQGHRTEVQCSLTLLPVDFPVYDKASNLEFGQDPLYLGYKITTDIGTLTDFYLTEMSTLDWTEMPETASITPKQATLFFVGQRFYANDSEEPVVMLELAMADVQAKATLHQVEAD